jgi:hypothetical protein
MKSWLSKKFGGGADRDESEEYNNNNFASVPAANTGLLGYFDPSSLNLGNQA